MAARDKQSGKRGISPLASGDNPGTSASKRNIADAVVIKDEDVFMLTELDGSMPLDGQHGLGLYYNDCRYLCGYALTLDGTDPTSLVADAGRGFSAFYQLTNGLLAAPGREVLEAQSIGIRRERVIDGDARAVHEVITLRSYAARPVAFTLGLAFASELEDIFVVRGIHAPLEGARCALDVTRGALRFSSRGGDGVHRALTIDLAPAPERIEDEDEGASTSWRITLAPQEERQILISFAIEESAEARAFAPPVAPDLAAVQAALHRKLDDWVGAHTGFRSGNALLDATLRRSLLDLRLLQNRRDGRGFFSAGVPWYAALFGRDSLIAACSMLAFEPNMAGETLRLLAAHQATSDDPARDEEPGKILHELRTGELAGMKAIPFTPYYGSVDATPLFLVLVARHAAWSGSLDVFRAVEGAVDRALAWMTTAMDRSPGGYLRYERRSAQGLRNQGWKDSDDGIVMRDGRLAEPPIALAEVQGYAYLALRELADLFDLAGRPSADLRRRAEALRLRFERDFWLDDLGVYALALQGDGEAAAVVSSNAGQVLWSGIAAEDRAERVAARLMAPDMWSGWGVRTLSTFERRYNPIGYHLGTVWPHDNALVAAGLRRYGQDEAAGRIFQGILAIAGRYKGHRLPEVFSGFSRDTCNLPVRYPVACHPQAWAAASIPLFLTALLGLAPDAFARRLRVVRPVLPESVPRIELTRLRVGDARAALRFERRPDGRVTTTVLGIEGRLAVAVEA